MADESGVPDNRAVVLWRPREVPEHEQKMAKAREAEADARLAIAETKRKQADLKLAMLELSLSQFKKLLALSQHPDFANAVGPITPELALKLAEFVSKEHRLDNGQATENVAHAVAHTVVSNVDFKKLTQEERNKWRELAEKIGSANTGE